MLGYSNLQMKSLGETFPCIPMENLDLVLGHSCSLMHNIAKQHAP